MIARPLRTLWRGLRAGARFLSGVFHRLRRRPSQARNEPAAQTNATLVDFDPASPPVEAVHQHVVQKRARVVGLVGVARGTGVSMLARSLARRGAEGGHKTLLIDAVGRAGDESHQGPCVLNGGARGAVKAHADGYSTLLLRPSANEMLRVRNVSFLRSMMTVDLADYDTIIVDMLPAGEDPEYAVPAAVLGNACDMVLMICLTGVITGTDLNQALSSLRAVGAPLGGMILNRREQPTLGQEIAREAQRFSRLLPGFSRRIQRRALQSSFLDVHA